VVPLVPRRVDDAELVRALLARSPWAGEELVRRYGPDVQRVLARILGPSNELSDLAHDCMLRALGALRDLREPDRLRSWLVGIAVRVAREHLRQKRRRPIPVDDVPDHGVAEDPEGREALQRVFALLSELPDEERIAFALRFVDGMELKDVAAATEVSLATAKRRLARATELFVPRAKADPILGPRMGAGRWMDR
jgi:RNA polymerase sigma-70 factor (ECF subfamily)